MFRINIHGQHVCTNVWVCDCFSIAVNVLIWLSHFAFVCVCVSSLPNWRLLALSKKAFVSKWNRVVVFIYNGIIDFKFIFITFKIQPFFPNVVFVLREHFIYSFFCSFFSVALNWFVCMKNVYNQKSNWMKWNKKNWINSREYPKNNAQRTPTPTTKIETRHQNSGLSCVQFINSFWGCAVVVFIHCVRNSIWRICMCMNTRSAKLTKCKPNTKMWKYMRANSNNKRL